MARENVAFLYGIIKDKPTIKINDKSEFVVARIKMLTVRRSWASEELRLKGAPRTDIQYVITRNPAMIEKHIVPLKQGDVILVKGTISTREVKKKYICPFCHEINVHEGGVMNYVDPIFIEKTNEETVSEEEMTDKLLSKAEISNVCYVFGTLCREPEYYQSDTGKEECDFQIATNRKRRIREDDPEKTADYPYVKTFGAKTKEYKEVLHVGSEIFINGSLQAREVNMEKVCEYCGNPFEAMGATMEIVPYSIEYIKNCNIPEPGDDNTDLAGFDDGFMSDGDYYEMIGQYGQSGGTTDESFAGENEES